MQTVKHFLLCVPRLNRAENPVSPEDSGVFRYLNEKTYLRKYFKVFCVDYTNIYYVLYLARMSFKNGVYIRDVPRSILSDLDIESVSFDDFLDYCNASMLRRNLDLGNASTSNLGLTHTYVVPDTICIDTEVYTNKLMTHLCLFDSLDAFFEVESLTFAAPNGTVIVNTAFCAKEYGVPEDCLVSREYKGKGVVPFDRYISDCRSLTLFSREETVIVHEDDIPDDDEFNSCFAEYKEC